ncbi:MAG: hypothetical protein ISS33_02005 [Candidatus Omnitrophica bacterium]|nr:hypothetical protein [Candidatus Omnitrophota bacterium]
MCLYLQVHKKFYTFFSLVFFISRPLEDFLETEIQRITGPSEKSHYFLIVALKHLYVDTGKMPAYLVEALQKGKALREDADYYDDWSKLGSSEMLKLTEEFLTKTKKLTKGTRR